MISNCRALADSLCKGISKRTKFYAWDASGGAYSACFRVEGREDEETDYLVSIAPVPAAGLRRYERESRRD